MAGESKEVRKLRKKREKEAPWFKAFSPVLSGPSNLLNLESNYDSLDKLLSERAAVLDEEIFLGVAKKVVLATVKGFIRRDLFTSTVELIDYFGRETGNNLIKELNLKRGPGTRSSKLHVKFETQHEIFIFIHAKTGRCTYGWLRANRRKAMSHEGIKCLRKWEMSATNLTDILQSEAALKLLSKAHEYFVRKNFKDTMRNGGSEPRNHAVHSNQVKTEYLRGHITSANEIFDYLGPNAVVQKQFQQLAAALLEWHYLVIKDDRESRAELSKIFAILEQVYGHSPDRLQRKKTSWASRIINKRQADRKAPATILHKYVMRILDDEPFIETPDNKLILRTTPRYPISITVLLEKKAALASETMPEDDNDEWEGVGDNGGDEKKEEGNEEEEEQGEGEGIEKEEGGEQEEDEEVDMEEEAGVDSGTNAERAARDVSIDENYDDEPLLDLTPPAEDTTLVAQKNLKRSHGGDGEESESRRLRALESPEEINTVPAPPPSSPLLDSPIQSYLSADALRLICRCIEHSERYWWWDLAAGQWRRRYDAATGEWRGR